MPFSPPDIADLKAWWKADSLSLSDGDPVSSWVDSSGGGFTITQGTAGFRPVYKTSQINGKPIVRFDGTDDLLKRTMAACLFDPGDDCIFFLVFKPTGASTGTAGLIAQDEGAGDFDKFLVGRNTNGGPQGDKIDFIVSSTTGGTAFLSSSTTYPVGSYYAVAATKKVSTHTFVKAGVADGSLVASAVFPTTTADLTVGFSENDGVGGSGYFGGDIAEIIIYNRALTAQERNQVGNYLESEYGLVWLDEFDDVIVVGPDGSLAVTSDPFVFRGTASVGPDGGLSVTSDPFVFRDVVVVPVPPTPIPPPPEIPAPTVVSVVVLSSDRLRVTFSVPMENDAALINPANYTITPVGMSSARLVVTVTPQVTECENPDYVDLTLNGEMTTGILNYNLLASNVKNLFGVVITSPDDNLDFSGQGTPPSAYRAVPITLTTIQVFFTEPVKQVSAGNPDDALNPANYTVTGTSAVTVTGVASINPSVVELTLAGTVTPGSYELTLSGIRDLNNNLVTP